jgi:hypothetical protein
MPKQVVDGAMMMCTMGTGPGKLTVLPINMTDGDSKPAATVMDFKPMVNIPGFIMCISPANPQVAAATAAAFGVLTPQPCIPVTTSPWQPGSLTTTIQNQAALLETDMCMCTWTGVITITMAGQVTIDVGS